MTVSGLRSSETGPQHHQRWGGHEQGSALVLCIAAVTVLDCVLLERVTLEHFRTGVLPIPAAVSISLSLGW